MAKRFKNKTVVVTGCSAGIGRAVAKMFAKEGARVGLISRNHERLQSLKSELQEYGQKYLVLPLDVANSEAVEQAAQKVENELGSIDVWVNNAMVSVFSPVKEMTPADYKRVTEVTYLGMVHGTLAALKRMLPRDKGNIVQVGTALAYRGIPLQSAYCAAKHAVQGFVDSLCAELLHDKSNVKISMVQLPAHNTPQFDWVKSRLPNKPQPVPPIFAPEVAAKAILNAAHRPVRDLIVGWPALRAIWGNRLFPRYADKFLAKQGYDSQQTDRPENLDRANNLYDSVPGDFKIHGRFSENEIKHATLKVSADLGPILFAGFVLILAIVIILMYVFLNG